MVKLLKQSIFLLLVALFALTEADRHQSHDSDDIGKSLFSFKQKHDDEEKTKTILTFDIKKEEDEKVKTSTDADGNPCKCGDTQMKEFFDKFILLFRAYGSKELAPEIRSIAVKIVDFIMGYLAKEKPDEMGKFHDFLQSSVKLTSEAVTKSSGDRSKRHFGSFK